MDKPFSTRVNETKNNIVNILNTSGLHPLVMQYIIKDIYAEVNVLASEYTNREKQEYEESLLAENGNNKNENSENERA